MLKSPESVLFRIIRMGDINGSENPDEEEMMTLYT